AALLCGHVCASPLPTPTIGSLIVENSCRFPIFAWHAPPGRNISVASAIDPFEHVTFQYQAIHNQVFDVLISPDPMAVAKDIHNRIPGSDSDHAGINNGENEPGLAGPFTIFMYGWEPSAGRNMMTYTLDNCNGNPFVGHEVLLASSTEACEMIDWPAGVPTAPGKGQMWFDCPMTTWMTLTLHLKRAAPSPLSSSSSSHRTCNSRAPMTKATISCSNDPLLGNTSAVASFSTACPFQAVFKMSDLTQSEPFEDLILEVQLAIGRGASGLRYAERSSGSRQRRIRHLLVLSLARTKMASYDGEYTKDCIKFAHQRLILSIVEHSTDTSAATPSHPRSRRPDLSSFFARLNEIAIPEDRTRPHAVPVPGDVSATYRTLADAFNVMRHAHDGPEVPVHDGSEPPVDGSGHAGLISQMIALLLERAEEPPREVRGVSEAFCDTLERVPKARLTKDQSCPICNEPFLDNPYPLVVRLPCHPTHMFDLECVRPWLRLNGTCPICRADFGAKERQIEQERIERLIKRGQDEDEEDDLDGLYG
ncbi:hypothetical protein KEM54_004699, partial [Ascosphaera aggregata]